MKNSIVKLMGIIILVLSPFFVQAQFLDPVSFEVIEAPEQVKAGEAFDIVIEATIEGNWHLYSIHNDPDAGPYPTQFSSISDSLVVIGEVEESEAVIEYDPNFETDLGWHTSKATFYVPVTFKKDISGEATANLEVLYQVCDDKSCLPPKKKKITHTIEISGVADNADEVLAGNYDISNRESKNSGSEQTTTGGGVLAFMWLALAAGFAALLTPCVFPMIPLTISFFSKQKEGEGNSRKAVVQAVGFGVAIILTFTILGVLLALVIGASGANQFAANPWVNLFIAIILVVFAVSLLGAFELRLPYQLTNWLNKKSNESKGILGVLFMALTISAVSFSCTAPFVGGVLAATAGGEWFYPILGMVGFSAAFASPFVILALFPRWLESLPKSGSWMNMVKVLLGFIELAAAFKFLSNADLVWSWGLVSRPLTIAAWIAIFLLAGLYVLGVYSLKNEEQPKQIGTGRLFLAIPLFLFSFYLIPGLLGANLGIWDAWLPPKQSSDVSVVRTLAMMGGTSGGNIIESENWSEDYALSVDEAKKENKPIFIDFTGYTCTNCRAMEANIFPLASIQQRFKQMKKVRLYTDDGTDGPKNQKFQFQLTGTVALPTYIVLDPYTEKVLEQFVGMASEQEFKQFLDKGLSSFETTQSSSVQATGQ
ncbi:MAG: cytochrome c biogenesis protein CcdA [Balneolaceae bacterium]|nr:cytochrome c biogenesis protein CcdA [Balneolaceae bacterium]